MPNARPNATSKPARSAVIQSRRGLGENGARGTSARSISCTLLARLLPTTRELLLLLQQRLIDLPVAVGLALQHEVVAALAIEVHRRGLLPSSCELRLRSSIDADWYSFRADSITLARCAVSAVRRSRSGRRASPSPDARADSGWTSRARSATSSRQPVLGLRRPRCCWR